MFLLVLSEASGLRVRAAGLRLPWVEERVLSGLECPAGPGQLPGAGLQQVRRSSWNIVSAHLLRWFLTLLHALPQRLLLWVGPAADGPWRQIPQVEAGPPP